MGLVDLLGSALCAAVLLVLAGCENLHNRDTWAPGFDISLSETNEQRMNGAARRYAALEADMRDCGRQSATLSDVWFDLYRYRSSYIDCMRSKGWSLVPSFAL